jgi:diguanylate cyclase (GGDEF)-like protein/PAS domain S-box-containing protein
LHRFVQHLRTGTQEAAVPDRRQPATGRSPDPLARRRAEALAEHGTDLPLLADPDGTIRYVGPSIAPLFGYHTTDVLNACGWDFVHPDDEPAVRDEWDRVVATPGGQGVWETRVRRADSSWVWVEERATNLLDDPAVASIVVNIRDVSDVRKANESLHERDEFYRRILAVAQEGVWVVDDTGRTLYANEAMADILGVTVDEVLAGAMWDFVDRETEGLLRATLASRVAGAPVRHELAFTRRDGVQRALSISAAPLTSTDGQFVAAVGTCVDITDRKRQERELLDLALHDPLTDLPNRHLLADRLKRATEHHEHSGAALSVLFANLDRFKLVNDGLGHEAGDALLREVAHRLRAVVRDGDTLARFGADEFVVVCPDADSYVALRIAESVQAAFADEFALGGGSLTLSMSIGIACTDKVSPAELLRAADRAARRAKTNGRGRIEVHDPAVRRLAHDQLRLVTDLRTALRTGGLELHYQPIVHADGRVCSVEALLRWNHPQLGAVSPVEAIAAAEDNGLMPALGEWILRRACVDIARLEDTYGLQVAINLSTRHLTEAGVVGAVERALRLSGLAPERVTLEVTETSLLLDSAATLPTLQRFKALGVRIALDDFGTGYSSLSYLRDFPVDVIKIDRSFVSGMMSNRGDMAIVATLINLAATVDLDVVAEGVETADQAVTIRRLGATHGQGYLWSPAVPFEQLQPLLRTGRFDAIPREATTRQPRVSVADSPVGEEQDRARIIAMHRSGASPSTIAAALNAEGRRTRRGGRWHRNTVAQVIAETAFPDLSRTDRSTGAYPDEPVATERR